MDAKFLPLTILLLLLVGCGGPRSDGAKSGDVAYGVSPMSSEPFWTLDGTEQTIRRLDHRRGLLDYLGAVTPYPFGVAASASSQDSRHWPQGRVLNVTDSLVGVGSAPWCAMSAQHKAHAKALEVMMINADGYAAIDADTRARCNLRLYVTVDARQTRFLAVYRFAQVRDPAPMPPIRQGRISVIVTAIQSSRRQDFDRAADALAERLLVEP